MADIEIADAVRMHAAAVAEQDIEIVWADIVMVADGTAGWDESCMGQEVGPKQMARPGLGQQSREVRSTGPSILVVIAYFGAAGS